VGVTNKDLLTNEHLLQLQVCLTAMTADMNSCCPWTCWPVWTSAD